MRRRPGGLSGRGELVFFFFLPWCQWSFLSVLLSGTEEGTGLFSRLKKSDFYHYDVYPAAILNDVEFF